MPSANARVFRCHVPNEDDADLRRTTLVTLYRPGLGFSIFVQDPGTSIDLNIKDFATSLRKSGLPVQETPASVKLLSNRAGSIACCDCTMVQQLLRRLHTFSRDTPRTPYSRFRAPETEAWCYFHQRQLVDTLLFVQRYPYVNPQPMVDPANTCFRSVEG